MNTPTQAELDPPVVIPLFGAGCHICGLPARWFVAGLTLPCGCGAQVALLTHEESELAIKGWICQQRQREAQRRREEQERCQTASGVNGAAGPGGSNSSAKDQP